MNTKLLKEVRDAILLHSDQVYMGRWFSRELDSNLCDNVGGCGTAGCIGGWALFLKSRKKTLIEAREMDEKAQLETSTRARKALGLTTAEGSSLFYIEHWPKKLLQRLLRAKTAKSYAQAVADRIDYFLKEKK